MKSFITAHTGRTPCIRMFSGSSRTTPLDRVFDVDIERTSVDNTSHCPVHRFRHLLVYAYSPRVMSLVKIPTNRSIMLIGSFASWRYTQPIDERLRGALKFRREILQSAARFLSVNAPPGWTGLPFVRVGVHVRRGDFLRRRFVRKGFSTAPPHYLRLALGYFVRRFARVQFVVTSNDIPWCRRHIEAVSRSWDQNAVNVTFSEGHSAGTDLAILAACNHTVITAGTFGWWAAWFVNGITTYYSGFPRPGSLLSNRSHLGEYYPPNWIRING